MRRPIPLFACLIVVLFALAAAVLPSRERRDDLIESALVLAGKLPLPDWLESKRIEWADRIYLEKVETVNPPSGEANSHQPR